MKKIVALFLAVLFCLQPVAAFAEDIASTEDIKGEEFEIVELDANTSVLFTEGNDGNVQLYYVRNGKIEAEYYVNRLTAQITSKFYQEDGSQTTSTYNAKSTLRRTQDSGTRTTANSVYMGTIEYEYYIQGYPFTHIISVSYINTRTSDSTYDLNGTYQNFASFLSLLCGVFSAPASILSQFASATLAYFGIATSAVSFVIPTNRVSATEDNMTWETYCGSVSGGFGGSKYTLNSSAMGNKVYTDTHYYASSSYTNHNASLGNTIYSYTPVYKGDGGYSILNWN